MAAELLAVVDAHAPLVAVRAKGLDELGAEELVLAAVDGFAGLPAGEAFGFLGLHCLGPRGYFLFGLEAAGGARVLAACAGRRAEAAPRARELCFAAQRLLVAERLDAFGGGPAAPAPRLRAGLARLLRAE